MANKVSQKKNQSSTQVIKTLRVLMQGNYTMNELIDILNVSEAEPVFNNSVVSKYINTCRYCGIDISKVHNKYYLTTLPFGMDLSFIDIDLLSLLQSYVKVEISKRDSNLINSFTEKITRFSNKKISRVEKKELSLSAELFERAIAKKHKIKLLFKNRDILECIPVGITSEGDKTFFNIYNKRHRSIDISRLSGVEISDRKYADLFNSNQVVVFKLKPPLAKRYEARENEQIEENPDGTIMVRNKNENKEQLFSRLLRYDDKCEIIQPKGYREDMKALIDDMLNNYGAGK